MSYAYVKSIALSIKIISRNLNASRFADTYQQFLGFGILAPVARFHRGNKILTLMTSQLEM